MAVYSHFFIAPGDERHYIRVPEIQEVVHLSTEASDAVLENTLDSTSISVGSVAAKALMCLSQTLSYQMKGDGTQRML